MIISFCVIIPEWNWPERYMLKADTRQTEEWMHNIQQLGSEWAGGEKNCNYTPTFSKLHAPNWLNYTRRLPFSAPKSRTNIFNSLKFGGKKIQVKNWLKYLNPPSTHKHTPVPPQAFPSLAGAFLWGCVVTLTSRLFIFFYLLYLERHFLSCAHTESWCALHHLLSLAAAAAGPQRLARDRRGCFSEDQPQTPSCCTQHTPVSKSQTGPLAPLQIQNPHMATGHCYQPPEKRITFQLRVKSGIS